MSETKKKKTFWQFVKFAMVGLCNTIVSYTVYSLCYHVLHINYHLSNAWGFVISVFVAYLLQSKFVFKESADGEHRVWWKVLIKTYVTYMFSGLVVTELLLILWLNVIHIEQYLGTAVRWLSNIGLTMSNESLAVSIAPFINMIFTIPMNFCLNKFWAYRQKNIDV